VPLFASVGQVPDDADAAALALAANRLRQEFSELDEAVVEATLRTSYEAVATDASVDSFLPLLAERRARKALHQQRSAGHDDDTA
jgi:hypothetical protein